MSETKPKARSSRGKKVAEAVAPVVVPADAGAPKAAVAANRLGLKELVAQVVAATGAKPSAVKPVVSATLTVLGQALERGDSMVLPSIGKVTVRPAKEGKSPRAMTVKVRPAGAKKSVGGKEALAAADEDN